MEYDLIVGLSIGLGVFIFASIAVVITRGRHRKHCHEHDSADTANTIVNPPTYEMAITNYPAKGFYEKHSSSEFGVPYHGFPPAQLCPELDRQQQGMKPPTYHMAVGQSCAGKLYSKQASSN